ncbi:slightly ste11-like protein [Coemansia helicoidea]|uniref:Slightly ste11-like protein n=2 Tax=Coemansia TaxID=4863 RepID=A0ACC1LB52_9FUNG|nr:slightly ste11-like protein [Coemansia helicoidea]
MDSFYMYPGSQFAGNPMSTQMGYSTPGAAPPLMGGPGDHQQLSMMQQYAHGVFPSKMSPAPAPAPHSISARIPGDHGSAVYCHDRNNGGFMEQPVRQMVMSDGSVFVEHIPGYNIVYVSNHAPVHQVLGEMCAPQRAGAGNAAGSNGNSKSSHANQTPRAPRERMAKPSNAFIMYRNYKIEEMRRLQPEINQIDISRKAGDMWKTESEDVKEQFRAKYRAEKQAYDLKKNTGKRGRGDSVLGLDDDDTQTICSGDGLSTPGSSKKRKNSNPGPGLGLGLGGGSGPKPRSRTMPSSAFSSSDARSNIFADLRKQVAARSGAAFLESSPFDSPHMHQAYADMASSGSMANSPIPSIMGGAAYMHGDMPALSLSAVQGLPPTGMSAAEHEAIYASHHADLSAGVDPAALGTPDQTDLTNSFVNAGIAAGISMIPADAQGLPMGSEAGDIAAAASLATSAVMAGGFYSDKSGDARDMSLPEHHQSPAGVHWVSQPAETPSVLAGDAPSTADYTQIYPTADTSDSSATLR